MTGERKRSWKRYGIIAACGALVLAVGFGAYRMGRSAGPGSGDIGKEAAKAAALNHAGVMEDALSRYEITLDESDGTAVYDVEFEAEGCTYDYAVSAVDGSIVKFSRETGGTPAADRNTEIPVPEDGQISEAQAWEIAYGHAGVAAEDAAVFRGGELDYDDGVLVYELEFFSGGYEYNYEINAADGSVVKFEKEADKKGGSAQPPAGNPPAAPSQNAAGNSAKTPSVASSGAGNISEAQAKEIALAHAGVAADSVSGYKWELDYDNGISVYELEFFSGGYEYGYEIKAADGGILKFEKEAVDAYAASQSVQGAPADAAPAYIGEARAKEIAYGHACLTADAVVYCGVELDPHSRHHSGYGEHHAAGCCAYEIDFKSGGYEYEYKIDAVTGEILEFEQGVDD